MADKTDVARILTQDFATTRWSLVAAATGRDAGRAGDALSQLCEIYWYPLYMYVRSRVADANEAQDFTQAFFVYLLEKRCIANADESRGRFRAFLLMACKRFLINEWRKARAAKRGGGQPLLSLDFDLAESKYSHAAVDDTTAEQLYDRQWAVALLERTLEQLRADYVCRGRLAYFDTLKQFLNGPNDETGYAEAGQALGITGSAASVATHRLRKRYRKLLRAEIAQTVERPEEIDEEIRELFAVFSTGK